MDTKAAHVKLIETLAGELPNAFSNYATSDQLTARALHCRAVVKAMSDYLETLTADLETSTVGNLAFDESDVTGFLHDFAGNVAAAHDQKAERLSNKRHAA